MSNAPMTARGESFWMRIIGVVSALLIAAVFFLIYGPRLPELAGRPDVSALPHLNAALNATSGVLLLVGWRLILRGRIVAHRRAMLSAFAASGGFLVSYVLYHAYALGPTRYQGAWSWVYFPVLISHIVLAVAVVPLALITLYRGWHWEEGVERHRRIARVTLPVWLYVSATGVVIWGMLYW